MEIPHPTRPQLDVLAQMIALVSGTTPRDHRQEAAEHFKRVQELKTEGLALIRQIENGTAKDSKRNRKKLDAIYKQAVAAITEGWALYQTALSLEAMSDPDILETLADEWPPDLDKYDTETIAGAKATAARPENLAQWLKDSIKAPLEGQPMLVLSQIIEHQADR